MDERQLAFLRQQIACAIRDGLEPLTRPSAVYRPALTREPAIGEPKWRWRATSYYVDGYGDTPEEALVAFDQAWKANSGRVELSGGRACTRAAS